MAKSKIRKFGYGGFTDLNQPVKPLPGFASLTMAPGSQSGSGGAYGGLDTVNQGSQQIGQSLQTIGDALGKPGGGGGGLGGALGTVGMMGGVGLLQSLANQAAQQAVGQTNLGSFGQTLSGTPMKKGGRVKAKKSYKSGGKVSSASKRADGCAIKGKTKGTMVKMKHGGAC